MDAKYQPVGNPDNATLNAAENVAFDACDAINHARQHLRYHASSERLTSEFDDRLVPSDKSISHRVLLLAVLEPGQTRLENVNMGGAITPLLEAFQQLGIAMEEVAPSTLLIGSLADALRDKPQDLPALNLGPSSTAARLLIGLLAGVGVSAIVDGDESLRPRPVDWVVDPLRKLGADIDYLRAEGELPIQINASKLHTGSVTLSVGSAQALSALLFAGYAANINISVNQRVRSRDHTQRIMRHLGATITEDGDYVHFAPGPYATLKSYSVPLDPSAVVYPVTSYLLQSEKTDSRSDLVIRNVCLNDTRTGFLTSLQAMGADIRFENFRQYFGEDIGDIVIPASASVDDLSPWMLDNDFVFHAMIDEIPMAAALASQIKGRSEFRGLGELTFKETNRITSTQSLLSDLGVTAQVDGHTISVQGGQLVKLKPAVHSYGDHRLAMSAAAICTGLNVDALIDQGGCCQTSYPQFAESMTQLSSGELTRECAQ
jgi:3-phosphoshikimate 1-carboxyvinyltransferase